MVSSCYVCVIMAISNNNYCLVLEYQWIYGVCIVNFIQHVQIVPLIFHISAFGRHFYPKATCVALKVYILLVHAFVLATGIVLIAMFFPVVLN